MVDNTLKTTRKKGLFLISLLGLAYILFTWTNATKTQNEEAINIGKTIISSISISDLQKLDAKITDLDKPEYQKIKSILHKTTETNRDNDLASFNTRFIYMFVVKNKEIFLLSDSELPNSKEYSPPGYKSVGVSQINFDVFNQQITSVHYSQSKTWGNWMAVLIPIIDPNTHKTIAVFGMDFNPFNWYKPIVLETIQSLFIVILAIIIFLFIIKIKYKSQLLKDQIEELENKDKKLKENETKLNETLKNSQDIFYKAALDGTILEVSESVHLFSGFVNKDLIGINVTDLYYDATDREKLMGILLKKGKVRDYEIKMRHNQTIRYFLLNCTIVLNENKKPLHIEGAMKDITERRVAKEKLIESETFLKAIINHQPECIKIVDSKGRLIMMNPSGLEMIEADFFEQVEGHNVIDLVDPKDQVNFQNMHKKVISGESVKLEFDINGLKGTKLHMETFAVPMEYKGQIVLLAHTRDITERKKSEILLKENEQFLNETQQIGHIGSYNFNIQNNSWKSSEVLNEIFGIDGDLKKTAETWTNLIHPEWRETMSNYLMNEVIGQKKDFEKEYKIIRQNDGAIRWVHGRGKVHFDLDGNPINLIGVIQDITNQKEAEEELTKAKEKAEESERLKSAFLANMSHEIRTPMNGILGFTELLKDPNLSGEEQAEYLNIIRKSGDRMLNIINDIIDISKIESGLMQVNFGETNVNDHIQYMHAFFKHEAFNQGIELKYDNELPFEEAFINTDKEKIINILTNLIKNAIKFTPKGNIDFGYRLKTTNNPEEKGSDKVLEFYVKDSGIGIDKTQQDLVFERFRQTNESTSKNYEGAGLGLAITKSFVEMLGGTIWVESELGKGSTFYFTLPYNPKPKSIKISETIDSIKDSESTSDLKILIVEDDEISGKLLEIAVKNISKSILRARNGIEAVDLAKNNPDIDLILMDIQMPKMDGHQATTEIRKFNKDVIILAQTAFAYSEDIEKAVDSGCNGHISKPVKKVELIKMVDIYFKDKVTVNK